MRLAILMAILVTGCAMQPASQQVPFGEPVVVYAPKVLDDNCASLAKYARAVAIMRDLNVKIDDVDFILKKAPSVPVGTVQRYVYYRSDTNPGKTSTDVYNECVATGYDNIIQRFTHEELIYNMGEERRILDELELKKKQLKKKVKK